MGEYHDGGTPVAAIQEAIENERRKREREREAKALAEGIAGGSFNGDAKALQG